MTTYTVVDDTGAAPAQPAGGGVTYTPAPDSGSAAPAAQPKSAWEIGIAALTGQNLALMSSEEKIAALKSLARQGGLLGRYALEGLAGLGDMFVNRPINAAVHLASGRGPVIENAGDVTSKALTAAGVPEPQGAAENFAGDVTRGVAPLFLTGPAGTALKASEYAGPAMKAIGGALDSAMGTQLFSSGAASAAGSVGERQLGLTPTQAYFLSLVTGVAAPAASTVATSAANAAGRGARATYQTFTEPGTRNITGNILNTQAQDRFAALGNIQNPQEFVPGSRPTTAEASRDPGLATMQRALQSGEGGADFAARAAEQNKARVSYLNETAKSPEELIAAIKDRTNQAAIDYGAARDAGGEVNAATNRMIGRVFDRPSVLEAWQRAEPIAADRGMKPQQMDPANPEFMNFVKQALDDVIDSKPQGSAAQNAALDAKTEFLKMLDNISPLYGIARGNFAQASKSINKMSTLQDVLKRAQLAAPDLEGNPVLSQAKFKQTLNSPGLNHPFSGLAPEDMTMLNNILADLDRSQATANANRPTGSNTAQNWARMNLISETMGPKFQDSPFGKLLAFPAKKIFEWSESPARVEKMLNEAALNPAFAAELMRNAKNFAQRTSLLRLLRERALPAAFGSNLGAMSTAEGE